MLFKKKEYDFSTNYKKYGTETGPDLKKWDNTQQSSWKFIGQRDTKLKYGTTPYNTYHKTT